MGKPIRTDLQLVTLEKPRNLLAFAARVNDNRQTFLPDHKAIGLTREPHNKELHGDLLDLNSIRFHTCTIRFKSGLIMEHLKKGGKSFRDKDCSVQLMQPQMYGSIFHHKAVSGWIGSERN